MKTLRTLWMALVALALAGCATDGYMTYGIGYGLGYASGGHDNFYGTISIQATPVYHPYPYYPTYYNPGYGTYYPPYGGYGHGAYPYYQYRYPHRYGYHGHPYYPGLGMISQPSYAPPASIDLSQPPADPAPTHLRTPGVYPPAPIVHPITPLPSYPH